MAVPYFAAFAVTKAFLAEMAERGSGNVCSIYSPSAWFPFVGSVAYTAARWALRGFSAALRIEMRGTGVTVTDVSWRRSPATTGRTIPDRRSGCRGHSAHPHAVGGPGGGCDPCRRARAPGGDGAVLLLALSPDRAPVPAFRPLVWLLRRLQATQSAVAQGKPDTPQGGCGCPAEATSHNWSRYGAIVIATGETLEPSRSDHRCPTPAFGVAAVAGRRYRERSLAGC